MMCFIASTVHAFKHLSPAHCRCVQGLIVTADRVVDSDSDDTQDLEKLKEMLSMLAQKYSTADVADLGFDKATANNAGAYSR